MVREGMYRILDHLQDIETHKLLSEHMIGNWIIATDKFTSKDDIYE
jgi:hypothetical protein